MTGNHNEEVISEKILESQIKSSSSDTLKREVTKASTNTPAIIVQDKARPAQEGEDVHDRELSAGVAKVEVIFVATYIWLRLYFFFLSLSLTTLLFRPPKRFGERKAMYFCLSVSVSPHTFILLMALLRTCTLHLLPPRSSNTL